MKKKLEIEGCGKDFKDKIVLFIWGNSLSLDRHIKTSYLLERDTNLLLDSLDKKINKLGSTYQSRFRDRVNLNNATHMIKYILMEDDKLYGLIEVLDVPGAEILKLDESKMVLRPVYDKNGNINTFDVSLKKI